MNNKQLIEWIEFILNWLPNILAPVLILFSLLGLGAGLFLMLKPALAIEIQRRVYLKINWRIEPISIEKELRNSRIMGWFLMIISAATIVLMLTNKSALP
jgi:hypothetical protein